MAIAKTAGILFNLRPRCYVRFLRDRDGFAAAGTILFLTVAIAKTAGITLALDRCSRWTHCRGKLRYGFTRKSVNGYHFSRISAGIHVGPLVRCLSDSLSQAGKTVIYCADLQVLHHILRRLWTLTSPADILELYKTFALGACQSLIEQPEPNMGLHRMSDDLRRDSREEVVREAWHESQIRMVAQPDWWSRLMAFGAMLLASAALIHSMGGLSALKSLGQAATNVAQSVDEGVGSVSSGIVKTASELAGNRSSSEETTGDPVAEPRTASELANTESERVPTPTESQPDSMEGMGDVNDLFDEPIEPAVATVDTPTEAKDADPPLNLIERNPALQVVRTALKPTGDVAAAIVTVKNTGLGDAMITDAVFIPQKVVTLPFNVSKGRIGVTNLDRLVVAFASDDNQASQPGRHADYEHRLQKPFKIPAGETVEVRIVIQDNEFIGYGFDGDMRLLFNDHEKLEVSGLTIAFVE